MFYYSIIIQFAKAKAPSFNEPKIKKLIDEAVNYYNKKSLLAANRKQIVSQKILDDLSMEIILESTAELQTDRASKALRVFSMYLISDDTKDNLQYLITGKRLFKMLPSKIENYSSNTNISNEDVSTFEIEEGDKTLLESINEIKLDELEMIRNFTELLHDSRKNNNAKAYAIRIRNILNSYEKRRDK